MYGDNGKINPHKTEITINKEQEIYFDCQRVACTHVTIHDTNGETIRYDYIETINSDGKMANGHYPTALYNLNHVSDEYAADQAWEDQGGLWEGLKSSTFGDHLWSAPEKAAEKNNSLTLLDASSDVALSATPLIFLKRSGAFKEAKRDLGIPVGQQPDEIRRIPLTDRNKKAVLDANGKPIMTREYIFSKDDKKFIIQDHSAGHPNFPKKDDPGSHFNVRPIENPRNGKVEGTKDHYPYKKE